MQRVTAAFVETLGFDERSGQKSPEPQRGRGKHTLRVLIARKHEAMRTPITAAPGRTLANGEALIEAAAQRMIETTRKHWRI
jgi:hypothetical protein